MGEAVKRSMVDALQRFEEMRRVAAAGCEMAIAEEYRAPVRFLEPGHLVDLRTVAPSTVPRFGAASREEALVRLAERLQDEPDFTFARGYCLLEVMRC